MYSESYAPTKKKQKKNRRIESYRQIAAMCPGEERRAFVFIWFRLFQNVRKKKKKTFTTNRFIIAVFIRRKTLYIVVKLERKRIAAECAWRNSVRSSCVRACGRPTDRPTACTTPLTELDGHVTYIEISPRCR